MKSKLLNIVSYSLIGYSVGAAFMGTVPELQALIPQFTTQLAVWTGIPASTMGAIGLSVQSYINSARKTDLTMNQGVVGGLDKVFKKVDEVIEKQDKVITNLSSKYDGLERKYDDLKTEYKALTGSLNTLVKLVRVDLEAKLSNPLIDEEVKKLIEGALDEV